MACDHHPKRGPGDGFGMTAHSMHPGMGTQHTGYRHQPLARSSFISSQRRRRHLLNRATLWLSFLALATWVGASPDLARAASKDQMQSLDEQVQEIKSDVLGIAAELSNLEEKLLYPSNTQVAVFVSLAEDQTFRLDSVRIQIDGELVAHHIYSFGELEALRKGGVQRIYTGNIPTGEHLLEVSIDGKLAGGDDFSGIESFSISKEIEPKLVEISLTGPGSGDALIRLGSR